MNSRPLLDKMRAFARVLGRHLGLVLAVVMALVLGMCLTSGGDRDAPPTTMPADQKNQKSAPVWTCPMHPQIRKSEPGNCPICGMTLTLVEGATDESSAEAAMSERIALSDRARILARIRTTTVKPVASASRELRLLGRIAYDETRLKSVTAWTEGRIDTLRVATTGRTIKAQQTIARLYSPEIYAAQSDLIQARKQVERLAKSGESARRAAQAGVVAAEQRLRLLGVPASDVTAMGNAESPRRHVWIRTPFSGTVIERLVDEGTYVKAGTVLYRIADLSRVWVHLDAYETDLPLLALGNRVSLGVVGLPDRSFSGTVSFIDPVVDPGTRIVKLRVEADNKDGLLRPGMFAEAVLHGERGDADQLMIPRTAPLFTGVRSVVYVEVPDADRPTYQAREVTLGSRTGEFFPVLSGLEAGERVVERGAFVIDADLQIRGGASMMTRDDDVTRGQQRPSTAKPNNEPAEESAGQKGHRH